MPDILSSREWLNIDGEDYTNSLCLLLPANHGTLIDVEDFDRCCLMDWQVLGRTIFYSERWKRRTTMHSMPRMLINWHEDSCERHNFHLRLLKSHVDHENRNPWDQRRQNLRLATPSQNAMNRAKDKRRMSSQYKGVKRVGKARWEAAIRYKGVKYKLGTFSDEVEAALAYNAFVKAHCPEFGYLNPIESSPADKPTATPKQRVKRLRPSKLRKLAQKELTEKRGRQRRERQSQSLKQREREWAEWIASLPPWKLGDPQRYPPWSKKGKQVG